MPDSRSYMRAKAFRHQMTPPEARLWNHLRNGRLAGYKFRRQHPIGPYILDFYCPTARLAVEVDGAIHGSEEAQAHDRRRTAWLSTRDIRVIRIRAVHVRDELDGVLNYILDAIRERSEEA